MAVSITMPQLGESVTEGTVTRWLKDVGDTVEMDEPLLEVSTDKVDTEIPSPTAGVLLAIKAVEDEVVEVGAELAIVGEASEAEAGAAAASPAPVVAAPEQPAAAAAATPVQEAPAPVPDAAPTEPTDSAPPAASPAASAASTAISLPALGESVTEGTVTRWLKRVGDSVDVDEALVEVSTDKVDTEIPSPVAGILSEILVNEDETVDVGSTLATVSTGGSEPASAAIPAPHSPAAAADTTAPAASTQAPVANAGAGEQAPYASPIVRKLARERGVDLAGVRPSESDGRLSKADVLAATGPTHGPAGAAAPTPTQAASPAPAPMSAPAPATVDRTGTGPAATTPTATGDTARGQTVPMSRLRRVIAERMVESLHVSAQLTTVVEIDVSQIAAIRDRAKVAFRQREGVSLTYLPFFARAALEALKSYPTINASVDSDNATVTFHDSEHLGVAVDTDRGLLVPVVHNASDLTLAGLARQIADLAERTRTGRVGPDDLSGGTFTLTNTGSRGALFDTPIINQPQVAILATGAVVKRPIVMAGRQGEDVLAIRSMAYFALTYDHRIVDGADAARYLSAVKARLEAAEFEAEAGL
ncbi:MAG: 2-oxoglutarate dehydrogenase, E2 component, dihydrolipoamide succinyltransferase [Candidatus Nanopelagicales bacterium]